MLDKTLDPVMPRRAATGPARSRDARRRRQNFAQSSAIIAFRPWVKYMPSAAIDVTTVGTPSDMLWFTLPLTPAPKRRGATATRAQSKIGLDVRHEAEDVDARRAESLDFRRRLVADHLKHDVRNTFAHSREDLEREKENRVDIGIVIEAADENDFTSLVKTRAISGGDRVDIRQHLHIDAALEFSFEHGFLDRADHERAIGHSGQSKLLVLPRGRGSRLGARLEPSLTLLPQKCRSTVSKTILAACGASRRTSPGAARRRRRER